MTSAPDYPRGRDVLAGKTVLVTASAGTGIGFATAKRCAEEGAVQPMGAAEHEHDEALERETCATAIEASVSDDSASS